jgi:hypothetical protein
VPAELAKLGKRGSHGRGWWLVLMTLYVGLLVSDRRQQPRVADEPNAKWTLVRSWVLTSAVVATALFLVLEAIRLSSPIQYQGMSIPVQQQASVFVSLVSWAVFLGACLASTWTVLLYGSSKNRTDTAAALLVFGVLGIVNGIAIGLYGDDRSQVDYCAAMADFLPIPDQHYSCDTVSLANARINAEELQRISTLSTLGQIVPLLSISKDTLQAWFSPPGMDESIKPRSNERKRARQERRLTTEHTKLSWTPAWIAGFIAVGLWVGYLLSR